MKYPFLNKKTLKYQEIDVPQGGLNINSSAENNGGKGFTECNNIYFKDSVICNRPGLVTESALLVFEPQPFYRVLHPFTFTDSAVEIDGETRKIAYAAEWDVDSVATIYVYLVGNKNIISAGNISYNRISSDIFYVPEKISFFVAGGTKGCGIYAFIRSECNENYGYSVYELNNLHTEWIKFYETDFYCPTIYINGRGTLYDEILDKVYPYEPVELEQQNLLTGWFYAYFSSDGYSSTFQLPISNLDDENVICRVYKTPTDYTEWIIEPGKTSASCTFYSNSVTLTCDRSTGTLNFSSNGSDHPIQRMAQNRYNNIRIMACKKVVNGLETIVGSEMCVNFNSCIYVYGAKENLGIIASARHSKPMYFPVGSVITPGNSDSTVASMAVIGNHLLAFKSDGIYNIKNNQGKKYTSNEILIGKGTEFYKFDTLKSELLYAGCGCEYPDTLKTGKDTAIWMDSDREVYSLSQNGLKVKKVSGAISQLLQNLTDKECKNMKAVWLGDYYSLWFGNKALILDCSNDKVSWYPWSFSERFKTVSVTNIAGRLQISCNIGDDQRLFIAKLFGDTDILPDAKGNQVSEEIVSHFSIAPLLVGDFGARKRVDSLLITAASQKEMEVSLNGGLSVHNMAGYATLEQSDKRQLGTIKIRPCLFGVSDIMISFKATAPFAAGRMLLSYRELAEV